MTARERLAPLVARLRAALADEKQRVNLLVCMGLAGLLLLAVSSWLPADSSTQSAAPAARQHRRLCRRAGDPPDRTDFPCGGCGQDCRHGHTGIRQREHLRYRHRQRRQLHPCTFGQRRGGRPCGDRRDAPRARRRRCLRGRRQCCRAEPRHRPGAGTDRHWHQSYHRCKNGIGQLEGGTP